jgi:hypothetical protein
MRPSIPDRVLDAYFPSPKNCPKTELESVQLQATALLSCCPFLRLGLFPASNVSSSELLSFTLPILVMRIFKINIIWNFGSLLGLCLIAQIASGLPPDHLLLDCAPNLGPLISRWKINKFENCWYKIVRILEVLKLLFQQFLNLSSSQRDMGATILGDLSNNRWSGAFLAIHDTWDSLLAFKRVIHVFYDVKQLKERKLCAS